MTIIVGIGANLPSARYGNPHRSCEAALERITDCGVPIIAGSPWYESEPVPPADQPWYINRVVIVESGMTPGQLLTTLHAIESEFGRVRGAVNAARVLDIDLLDHDATVSEPGAWPVLPHPRMHQRAFVLLPLRDIRPHWRHPRTGEAIDALIAAMPSGQVIRRFDTSAGA